MNRRQRFEAAQRRRSIIIASLSTACVAAAVVLLVPLAPGWEKVRLSFFNGEILIKTFPGLLKAFLMDIAIFACARPSSLSGRWLLPSAVTHARHPCFRFGCLP